MDTGEICDGKMSARGGGLVSPVGSPDVRPAAMVPFGTGRCASAVVSGGNCRRRSSVLRARCARACVHFRKYESVTKSFSAFLKENPPGIKTTLQQVPTNSSDWSSMLRCRDSRLNLTVEIQSPSS